MFDPASSRHRAVPVPFQGTMNSWNSNSQGVALGCPPTGLQPVFSSDGGDPREAEGLELSDSLGQAASGTPRGLPHELKLAARVRKSGDAFA